MGRAEGHGAGNLRCCVRRVVVPLSPMIAALAMNPMQVWSGLQPRSNHRTLECPLEFMAQALCHARSALGFRLRPMGPWA